MAFNQSRRPVPRPPVRSTPVMAVGQHVFIHCAGNRSGSVTLADVSGKVPSSLRLADGIEVEVVAWRPSGASDTRYRVRAAQGADGWVPAENLRTALVPVPPPGVSTPARATDEADAGGRRFGQRSETERPPAHPTFTPAPPAPGAGTGGRRFGQHFETERSPPPESPTPAPATTVGDSRGRRFGQHF